MCPFGGRGHLIGSGCGDIWPPAVLGAIAQLGERLNGIQEVSGSIPLGSTTAPAQGSSHGIFAAVRCLPLTGRPDGVPEKNHEAT